MAKKHSGYHTDWWGGKHKPFIPSDRREAKKKAVKKRREESVTNEVYLGLIGGTCGRYWWGVGHWASEGSPCGVEFDPVKVMDRDEQYGDIVGFYHTHPHMTANPSSIDYMTMGAWTVCFGKPLVCLIKGSNGLKAHWFIDDETEHVTGWVRRFGNIFIGRIPGPIRKEMKNE